MSIISSQHLNHFQSNLSEAHTLAVEGNGAIGGSLVVGGEVASSSVAVTGAVTAATVSATGAASLGSLSLGAPVVVSAGITTIGDTSSIVICSFAGTMTLTLPAPSSLIGRLLLIKADVNQLVVSANANVIPLSGGAAATSILPGVVGGSFAILVSNGTNYVTMASG